MKKTAYAIAMITLFSSAILTTTAHADSIVRMQVEKGIFDNIDVVGIGFVNVRSRAETTFSHITLGMKYSLAPYAKVTVGLGETSNLRKDYLVDPHGYVSIGGDVNLFDHTAFHYNAETYIVGVTGTPSWFYSALTKVSYQNVLLGGMLIGKDDQVFVGPSLGYVFPTIFGASALITVVEVRGFFSTNTGEFTLQGGVATTFK